MRKMKPEDLGYTQKWFDYGVLSQEAFAEQVSEFQKAEDQNTEHYRYETLLHWMRVKTEFANLEIERLLELLLSDPDQLLAGSAIKELFQRPELSKKQFQLLKKQLPLFGDWTAQLIEREELKKKVQTEPLTEVLIQQCIRYSRTLNEGLLIAMVIEKTTSLETLKRFTEMDFGKRTRNLAQEKIRGIKKGGRV